jgi:peroxiredoxin Q/BCP
MMNAQTAAPAIGAIAPRFELAAHSGGTVSLDSLKGTPVVLYFYPKDDTPGCTIEAHEFRDALPEFERRGVAVLGVSPDNGVSHCAFAEKHGLNFRLLSDTNHAVAERYGAWVEKNRFGKKSMGIQRSTFLIDKTGKIAAIWPKVSPEGHAREVLEAVDAL